MKRVKLFQKKQKNNTNEIKEYHIATADKITLGYVNIEYTEHWSYERNTIAIPFISNHIAEIRSIKEQEL